MTYAGPTADDGALLPLDAVRERPATGARGAARGGARNRGTGGVPGRGTVAAGIPPTPATPKDPATRATPAAPMTPTTLAIPVTPAVAVPVGGAGLLELDAARATRGVPELAAASPVARVLVDTPLPHLDRPFDYLVPAPLDATAVPGCRVRVRFAGKLVDGFLLERAETTDHQGKLARLERVVSAEPVLTPEIAALARAVADRYAGTMADVLRLAVPPRHARVEAEDHDTPGTHPGPKITPESGPDSGPWADYREGEAFLAALARGDSPRAVWTALPGTTEHGPQWPEAVAVAVREVLRGGRGALVVLPDGKDVTLADAALSAVLGPGAHVALTADLGPAERYRRWLRALRGRVRVVVGTRGAAFAPVADLGLAIIWDDGDDLHSERLAPYPHAREVLALRAHQARAGLLIGGHARTAEATRLIAAGWAGPVVAARATVRARAPKVRPAGEDAELARDEAARAARLPSLAWRTLRAGLETGPVLVQVPRRGYLPALACQSCRAPARCGHCGGPFALRAGHVSPYCRWCGRIAADWRCPSCGGGRVRAQVVGARRTAEELGRAFPSVPVKTSGRDGVLATVGPGRALVVATPGAEPVPRGGYAAAVLLDGWALLGRPDLRAAEETLRRWMNAAALLRPSAELVVLADSSLPSVQALLRWDPVTHAERELADRTELGFPPAMKMATLTGSPGAVREMLGEITLPPEAQVLGPVPVPSSRGDHVRERAMVRIAPDLGPALAAALKGAVGVRSARKAPEVVKVCIDPLDVI
ncbi:primosomal protein N' [Streptosporangium longisporum]|uniref:Probable replication restart protein PriA n=1 Tax=Streptosporangium longisporum TaxID=46187 RepID=A0ABP6KLG1_9ACTN